MTEELLANAYIKGASDLLQGKIEGMPKVIVISEGATNGDMIEATGLFEIIENLSNNMLVCVSVNGLASHTFISFSRVWWNAPYKGSEG